MQRLVAARLICTGLIALGAIVSVQATPRAQQQTGSGIVATTLLETRLDLPAVDRLTLSAVSLDLNPGQTTLPAINEGTILLVVEGGTVRLTSDRPIAGARLGGDGTAGPRATYDLFTNQRAVVPTGTTFQIGGIGDQPARLFVIALSPSDASGGTEETPSVKTR
jgi:hypothetical protein